MDADGDVEIYFSSRRKIGLAKIDAPVTDTTVDTSVKIVRITVSHAYTVHVP
jgi:hypothetical protein